MVLPELNVYLNLELIPVLERARQHAENTLFCTRLPRPKQSLISADFGFHNAIKADSGRVSFIDFEYFGWDDPVRLTADFLLHPGTDLNEANFNRYRQGMVSTFQSDENFELRLLHLLPLYGIRWALILLNEFLPERWQARVFAGETASWAEIKAQQLKKSRIAADKAIVHLKLL
jgi:thiamine kinase-like enzyme